MFGLGAPITCNSKCPIIILYSMPVCIEPPAMNSVDSATPVVRADADVQLRAALRCLAKAVVVITCGHLDRRYAMAATAVSELSMDPPSLLVCVNRAASIFEPLTHADYFGVCILHSSQRIISENCSGALKGEARFAFGNWGESETRVPYLRDAQACIFCTKEHRIEYGTHGVFIGRVLSAHSSDQVSPLIYVDGGYRSALRRT
jgi:flavin reductase (DIM6/NTAB) family NADH-FMN oxidoreductase RutF